MSSCPRISRTPHVRASRPVYTHVHTCVYRGVSEITGQLDISFFFRRKMPHFINGERRVLPRSPNYKSKCSEKSRTSHKIVHFLTLMYIFVQSIYWFCKFDQLGNIFSFSKMVFLLLNAY